MKKLFTVFLVSFSLALLSAAEEKQEPAAVKETAAAGLGDAAASSDASKDVSKDAPKPPAKTIEESRGETLRYGTENEVADLVEVLKNENAEYLDDELVVLTGTTKNGKILSSVFSFFGAREKKGMEKRALEALEYWDEETLDTVTAAVNYLGNVKEKEAVEPLQKLIETDNGRLVNVSLRALGRIGKAESEASDSIADYLIAYYEERTPADETMREIILALGDLGSAKGVPFLKDIAENNDERPTRRTAAVQSLAQIGDPGGLSAITFSLRSTDPNVRAAAVAALGPFQGDEVDEAILEAFRDTYYRTRIGAAQAAQDRKMTAAVPYLKYRIEKDEVPAVKDEAVKALGAINNDETNTILADFFFERRTNDRIRIAAAAALIKNQADTYAERFIVEMDEAKAKNLVPLYNGLAKIIAQAETAKVEGLASRFLASGGVVEKSYAMDMILKNKFTNFRTQLEAIRDDEKSGTLARKAGDTLEKLKTQAGGNQALDEAR